MRGFVLFAQEKEAPSTTTGEKAGTKESPARPDPPGGMGLPLLLAAIFFVFYYVVLRPGQKRAERERQALTTNLSKNDKVITTSGIYGTIVSVSDKEDEIIVKVDDNTRLKMLKASVMRNLTREESLKAEKEQKEKDKTK